MTSKTEKFKERASIIHDNKYDYSLVEYYNINTLVTIICPIHGLFTQTPRVHIIRKCGCRDCGYTIKRKQTNIKLFGVESPLQNLEILQKLKDTNLERYGVEYSCQDSLVIEKKKQTCVEKYGVDNSLKNKEVREKIKQSMVKKHGFEYPIQCPTLKEKQFNTNLQRYGSISPFGNIIVQQTSNLTFQLNWGVSRYAQRHLVNIIPKLCDKSWLSHQYMDENKSVNQISIELEVGTNLVYKYLKIHQIELKDTAGYSYSCINWLNSVAEDGKINIYHATNGGEYSIPNTRYKADGYCKETNTIYEFHGDYWHGNPNIYDSTFINEVTGKSMGELYQKTIERENLIKSLGYNLIVLWESDYHTNYKKVLTSPA
jgi:hypothetical protein